MKAQSRTLNADCRLLNAAGLSAVGCRLSAVGHRLSALRSPLSAFSRRSGLSLLEVMLAIAILGLALATMGELVRIGTQAAAESRDLTKAQILCEGIMSELAAGIVPAEPADETPFELDPDWNYSVSVAPLDEGGLLEVTVLVQKEIEDGERPAYVTLTRWMIDPMLEQVEDSETILGGDSESSSQTGAAGQTGNQTGGSGAIVGGQIVGGQAAGGGPNQGGPGGGNQQGGGQFGGNQQGGGGQSGGGRTGGGRPNQGGPGGGNRQGGGGGQFGGGNRQGGGGGQFGGGQQGGGQQGGGFQGGQSPQRPSGGMRGR